MDKTIQDKNVIKKALISLMNKKTFRSITISDIISEAEIHRSTFYNYYFDKEDVFNDIYNECCDDLIHTLKASNPLQNQDLRFISINLFEHIDAYKGYYHILFKSEKSIHFQNKLIEVLIKYYIGPVLSTKSTIHRINKTLFTQFLAYGILGLIKNWDKNNYEQSSLELAQQLNYILSHNIDGVLIK